MGSRHFEFNGVSNVQMRYTGSQVRSFDTRQLFGTTLYQIQHYRLIH